MWFLHVYTPQLNYSSMNEQFTKHPQRYSHIYCGESMVRMKTMLATPTKEESGLLDSVHPFASLANVHVVCTLLRIIKVSM